MARRRNPVDEVMQGMVDDLWGPRERLGDGPAPDWQTVTKPVAIKPTETVSTRRSRTRVILDPLKPLRKSRTRTFKGE